MFYSYQHIRLLPPSYLFVSILSFDVILKGVDITYIWNLKYDTMNLFTKQPQISKQTYGYQRGNLGARDKLGAWR